MVSKYWSHTQMHVHGHTHGCRSKSEEKGGFRVFAFVERSKSVIGSLIITGLCESSHCPRRRPRISLCIHSTFLSKHCHCVYLSQRSVTCIGRQTRHRVPSSPRHISLPYMTRSPVQPYTHAAFHPTASSAEQMLPACPAVKKHSRVKMCFLIRKLQNVSYLLLLICS